MKRGGRRRPGGRKKAARGDLFAREWVHAFEEDTPEGEVYRPADADLPLARRPRERLRLSADGAARVLVPAPDDRLVEQAATWSEEGKKPPRALGVAPPSGDEIRIVAKSLDRLVVKRTRR